MASMPTLARLLCLAPFALAACAPAGAGPATDLGRTSYLQGLDSEYSARVDRMGGDEFLAEDSSMRQGLLAGDDELYVAASMFESGEHLGLDLIVLNRGGEPVRVERGDLQVFDASGRALATVDDFAGADELGLRGKRELQPHVVHRGMPQPQGNPSPAPSTGTPGGKSALGSPAMAAAPAADWPVDLVSPSRPARRPNAPRVVDVGPGQGVATWGYFRGEDPAWPLTAVLMLDDRQLLFRFDRP